MTPRTKKLIRAALNALQEEKIEDALMGWEYSGGMCVLRELLLFVEHRELQDKKIIQEIKEMTE